MGANAVIRMPGQDKEVVLASKPLAFLVTGQVSKCPFGKSLIRWSRL